jgi:nicotinamidase-related amidase
MITPDSVLIVIDMQNGFVSKKSEHIIPSVVQLVERWRAAGGRYVMTRFINEPDSPFQRLIKWTRMQGSPEIEIVESLRDASQQAVAVIDKPIYSFFTPEGVKLVEENGWEHLVLAGIATESCVLKTAADAFERGLTPWIVSDAVFSHAGTEPHEAGLLVARRFIGRDQVVDIDTVIADRSTPVA